MTVPVEPRDDITITRISPVLSYVLAIANTENISLDEAFERIKPMTKVGADGILRFKSLSGSDAPDNAK